MERSADFITFEGIDGCGKTTQLFKLFKYIWHSNKYNKVVLTREPYGDVKIRQILKEDKDPYSQAKRLVGLFVEDRRSHVKEFIEPCLSKGITVLSDRYDCSTLAYQQAQGIPLDELIRMHEGLPVPDLTFIVDVPIDIAVRRMTGEKNRAHEKKFEANIEFLENLAKNYLELPCHLPGRNFFIIDGAPAADEKINAQTLKIYKFLFEGEK